MNDWREVPKDGLPAQVARYCRAYQRDAGDGHLTVIVGKEPMGWHLSISHRTAVRHPFTGDLMTYRVPSYEELKEARYRFVPDEVCMAQVFPPKKDFVNYHPATLHLWECDPELANR